MCETVALKNIFTVTRYSGNIILLFQFGWRAGCLTVTLCPIERVVISQNEFCDSALAYFNVFFNFGVGSFSSIFRIQAIFMGVNGFSKILFCNKSQNFKVVQIAI